MTIAHLYNMVRQKGDLQSRWNTLVTVMENFKCKMFHGNLPTEPDDIVRRFMVCCGIKASELSLKARKSTLDKLKEGRTLKWPAIIEGSVISNCLERYLEANTDGERFLLEIHMLNRTEQATSIISSELSHIELLTSLRDSVQDSLPRIHFDYITLNRQCHTLLEKLRGDIKYKLGALDSRWMVKKPRLPACFHRIRPTTGCYRWVPT